MSTDRTAFAFSDEQMTGIQQNITTIDGEISPNATNLTTEEKRYMWKMGPQALPFVEETLRCAEEYTQFQTSILDLDRFRLNLTCAGQTNVLANNLAPVVEKITETSIAAGADAFADARVFYESVKAAVKANKPGADAVLERMQKVYYKKPNKPVKKEPTEPTTEPTTPVV